MLWVIKNKTVAMIYFKAKHELYYHPSGFSRSGVLLLTLCVRRRSLTLTKQLL